MTGRLSYPVRVGLLVAAVLVAAAAAVSLGTQVSPAMTLATLLSGTSDDVVGTIVFNVRVPRVLVALFAGASLGVSGLLLQVALRNPLAAPEIVGVSSGAVLGAVAALSFGVVEGAAPAGIVAAATLGGLTAAALLWPWALLWIAVAWTLAAVSTVLLIGDGPASSLGLRPPRTRLLLVGVAVALAAGAVAVVGPSRSSGCSSRTWPGCWPAPTCAGPCLSPCSVVRRPSPRPMPSPRI